MGGSQRTQREKQLSPVSPAAGLQAAALRSLPHPSVHPGLPACATEHTLAHSLGPVPPPCSCSTFTWSGTSRRQLTRSLSGESSGSSAPVICA